MSLIPDHIAITSSAELGAVIRGIRIAAGLTQAATAALSASPVGAHALELGLDLVLDPEGEPHLIEVNARPNGRLEVLASQDPTRFATAHLDACLRPLRTLAAWAG